MTDDSEHDFLSAFDEHCDHYRKQLKVGRQEVTEDSIHDLRVAARRMQALLGIVRTLDSRPRVKKMQRFLRKQLDQLDDLRDTQVMMQEADSNVGSLPQLIPFREYLQERSADLARAGEKHLHKTKPSDLQERVKKIRKVIKRHSNDEGLVERLLQAVDGANATVLARFGKLDAGDPNTVHRVRIAFKKFRYMTEIVQPFLPDYPADLPDKMHDYQDLMGKVHDTGVFLDTLRQFELDLKQRGQDEDVDLKPVEVFFRTRLADLILNYFQRKEELHSFWRGTPDQPFPWEKSHDSVHRTTRNRRAAKSGQQRGAGQPATAHRGRTKEVSQDRAGAGQPGDKDRPDIDQSVPTGS